jgi:hypothetical protein
MWNTPPTPIRRCSHLRRLEEVADELGKLDLQELLFAKMTLDRASRLLSATPLAHNRKQAGYRFLVIRQVKNFITPILIESNLIKHRHAKLAPISHLTAMHISAIHQQRKAETATTEKTTGIQLPIQKHIHQQKQEKLDKTLRSLFLRLLCKFQV